MNIGYNSLRFWLDLLLLPIINVVSVDLQLTIIIRNNTINLICLSNSSRNDIDIIGSKDNDFGQADSRLIPFSSSTPSSNWQQRFFSDNPTDNIDEEWHNSINFFTDGNTTAKIDFDSHIDIYVYGTNPIILYEYDSRIKFDYNSNIIYYEKRLLNTNHWLIDENYAVLDTLFDKNNWNHIKIKKSDHIDGGYIFVVNEKKSIYFDDVYVSQIQLETDANNTAYWKVVSKENMRNIPGWSTNDEIKDLIELPITITPIYNQLCVSLTVQICDICMMSVGLYDNNEEIIVQKIENQTDWNEIELNINDVSCYSNYGLKVRISSSHARNYNKFWDIKNVKYCNRTLKRITKTLIPQSHLEDSKCISRSKKSVFYTSPRPYEEFPTDVKMLSNNYRIKEWNNIICINHNNTNKCYCGEGFEGSSCTAINGKNGKMLRDNDNQRNISEVNNSKGNMPNVNYIDENSTLIFIICTIVGVLAFVIVGSLIIYAIRKKRSSKNVSMLEPEEHSLNWRHPT